ncbi:MAG: hypothetical protein CXT72_06095 [Methanobacteriota archaeon]|nr:MAG: hypothetical protein CXT72_06095 [Euryarchaeota archaeon]
MLESLLIDAAARLRDDVESYADDLVEQGLVDCIYNPLVYAWQPHLAYLKKAAKGKANTLLLGMNPGPHGMGQMGIPFAATAMVREILEIRDLPVEQPRNLHPKRPVSGLSGVCFQTIMVRVKIYFRRFSSLITVR